MDNWMDNSSQTRSHLGAAIELGQTLRSEVGAQCDRYPDAGVRSDRTVRALSNGDAGPPS
jgi:hypothetical protein